MVVGVLEFAENGMCFYQKSMESQDGRGQNQNHKQHPVNVE